VFLWLSMQNTNCWPVFNLVMLTRILLSWKSYLWMWEKFSAVRMRDWVKSMFEINVCAFCFWCWVSIPLLFMYLVKHCINKTFCSVFQFQLAYISTWINPQFLQMKVSIAALLIWKCLASSKLPPQTNWLGEWFYWISLLKCDEYEALSSA
jgi:hypothetical protein